MDDWRDMHGRIRLVLPPGFGSLTIAEQDARVDAASRVLRDGAPEVEPPPPVDMRPPPFWLPPSLNTRLSGVEERLAAMEAATKPAVCGAMFYESYTCERDAGHKEPRCALHHWLPLGPKPF